jgi:hypothetical protein
MAGDDCVYATVRDVRIVSFDDQSITFVTRCAAVDKDARLPRRYKVRRDQVAEAGFSGGPAAVRIAVDEIGALYLDADGWATKAETTGELMFGSGQQVFKWPRCGDAGQYTELLAVEPSKVEIHGQLEGSNKFIDVDVWNPAQAASSQTIEWDAVSYIAIELATDYAQHLGVAKTVKLFPTRILVTGYAIKTGDETLVGAVEVLERAYAAHTQDLSFADRDGTLDLDLTEQGHGKLFTVTSAMERYAAGAIGGRLPKGLSRPELQRMLEVIGADNLRPRQKTILDRARARYTAEQARR